MGSSLCPCSLLTLLRNGSVKIFPRNQIPNMWWKESRRLFLLLRGERFRECMYVCVQSSPPPVEGEWPLLSSKRGPDFKTRKTLGKKKNMAIGPNRITNQDLLCWRGPVTIFSTRPAISSSQNLFFFVSHIVQDNDDMFRFFFIERNQRSFLRRQYFNFPHG
jgi:hypothetical protein